MTSTASSDGSVGEQGSAPITGSRPRKSLDELLNSRRRKDGDFADMPSLSSFRADDMSAITSTSYLSHASSSRGGDSRAGDDNASLPSLSSFRMEDLSTCSSYHSLQTTVQVGDYPGDTWASFRIGNLSIDTNAESDDDRRRMKLGVIRVASESSSAPKGNNSCGSSPILPAPPTKGVLKQDSKRPLVHETKSEISSIAPDEAYQRSTLLKRSTTKVIISTESEISEGEKFGSQIRILASATHDGGPSEQTIDIKQNKSPQLPSLEHPLSKNHVAGPTLKDSMQVGGSAELLSSLRGGDILLRLPNRRSSAVELSGDDSVSFSDDEASQDASRLSDDSTRISSDDDETHISDAEVSIGSGVESDISIETNADSDIMASVVSERSIIETQSVTPSEEPSVEARGDGTSARTSGHDATSAVLLEDPNRDFPAKRTHELDLFVGRLEGSGSPQSFQNQEIHPATNTDETAIENEIEKNAPSREKPQDSGTDRKITHAEINEDRRGLLRRVSSSLKSIGRSGSFMNSFRKVAKGASKLKQSASSKLPPRDVAALDKASSGDV